MRACAHGEFDRCRNGRHTERGIKEIDGYAAQLWTVESDYAVKLDARMADVGTLMEPTTVVVKAWEQVDRIGARAWYEPRTVLVTGAGPIGLLAALLGAQRGLDVHVLDRVTTGPKVDAGRSASTPGRKTGRSCWRTTSSSAASMPTCATTGLGLAQPSQADLGWLRQLIIRRVPLERFADALNAGRDDIKVVLTLSDQGR